MCVSYTQPWQRFTNLFGNKLLYEFQLNSMAQLLKFVKYNEISEHSYFLHFWIFLRLRIILYRSCQIMQRCASDIVQIHLANRSALGICRPRNWSASTAVEMESTSQIFNISQCRCDCYSCLCTYRKIRLIRRNHLGVRPMPRFKACSFVSLKTFSLGQSKVGLFSGDSSAIRDFGIQSTYKTTKEK